MPNINPDRSQPPAKANAAEEHEVTNNLRVEANRVYIIPPRHRAGRFEAPAVVAGCVDFVLSPENIAKEPARIVKYPYVAGRRQEVSLKSASCEHVSK